MNTNLDKRAMLLAALCVAFAGTDALAQTWPERPIKLVVGFPPGGSTDLGARALAVRLGKALGQPVVVENKAGASGNIGADTVARAPADGYTLMMASPSFAAAPAFFDKLGWDPIRDFTPIAFVATMPILAVTTPSLPVRSLRELVAYSKANPGKVNLASAGATTLTRLSGEQFKQVAGLNWTTVHYKGGAPALQDMLGGSVQVMFANISDVITHVKAGKLVPMAVTTPARSSVVPDVPTVSELGWRDFSFSTWQVVVGPAGMPGAIVERLSTEIGKIVSSEEARAQFLSFGTETLVGGPDDVARQLAADVATIKQIARTVGAKNE